MLVATGSSFNVKQLGDFYRILELGADQKALVYRLIRRTPVLSSRGRGPQFLTISGENDIHSRSPRG